MLCRFSRLDYFGWKYSKTAWLKEVWCWTCTDHAYPTPHNMRDTISTSDYQIYTWLSRRWAEHVQCRLGQKLDSCDLGFSSYSKHFVDIFFSWQCLAVLLFLFLIMLMIMGVLLEIPFYTCSVSIEKIKSVPASVFNYQPTAFCIQISAFNLLL